MELTISKAMTTIEEVTKDYLGLVEKVNTKLRTLRADLISMRRQDVKLLKQLVSINDVIQAMYQRAKEVRSNDDDDEEPDEFHDLIRTSDMWENVRRTPLVRQQSVPYYCGAPRSCTVSSIGSSMDELDELPSDDAPAPSNDDNDSLFYNSGALIAGNHRHYIRQRATSYEATCTEQNNLDDRHFEDMLVKNIQLWKYSLHNMSEKEPQMLPVR